VTYSNKMTTKSINTWFCVSINHCCSFSVHKAYSFFLQSDFCSGSNHNNSKLATLLYYKYPVQQDKGKSRQERPLMGFKWSECMHICMCVCVCVHTGTPWGKRKELLRGCQPPAALWGDPTPAIMLIVPEYVHTHTHAHTRGVKTEMARLLPLLI